jgi:S-adenosylmethionine:tRNA ribosyltransferase-isomerase
VRASDFDFALPSQQIAQVPLGERDQSRLFVVGDAQPHRHVRDLPSLLREDSLIVVNDTRVIPARLRATKPTGGRAELLLIEPLGEGVWRCLGGASKPIRLGPLTLDGERAPAAEVVRTDGEFVDVAFRSDEPLLDWLERLGEVPLPPYIERQSPPDQTDKHRYQTVYAREPGAVAAPTAGLHFTPELLQRFDHVALTLHVGPGTFAPLRSDEIAPDQELHAERYQLSDEAATRIQAARAAGRPIVAVGTTVVRALESSGARPGAGQTRLFIKPGYKFSVVDQLLTNFHLPKSSLLMLVCAFGGTERVLAAYADAVRAGYRFFSYGDAMLLRP